MQNRRHVVGGDPARWGGRCDAAGGAGAGRTHPNGADGGADDRRVRTQPAFVIWLRQVNAEVQFLSIWSVIEEPSSRGPCSAG